MRKALVNRSGLAALFVTTPCAMAPFTPPVFAAPPAATDEHASPRPRVSLYFDVTRSKCRTDLKKPLSQLSEHETITYFCKMQTGYELTITYHGTSVAISFKRVADRSTAKPQLGAGYDIGDSVEWRGTRAGQSFVPDAAILRLKTKGADGRMGAVLAVMRVEGAQICPAAYIDALANKDANMLARSASDEAAKNFRCGSDQAKIIGVATPLAQETTAHAP